MNLPFTIRVLDGVPVSDQVVQAVRKAVFSGQLADASEFPSVRALSQSLRISPTTAHKVVSQLKAEGLLASRPGIGMVVTARNLPSREERLDQLRPACLRFLEEAAQLNLTAKDAVDALKRAAADTSASA
ncbi:MAG: GntR family transcriptional regulator [Verrucomicrobiales bacterium]|nr:GntR family transcriptional regulator [Verrucomicrobiales bacterium]